MDFKSWLYIVESKEEKTLALELAGDQDNYNQLLSVIPQNQKESDPLLLLSAYYLSKSKNLEQIKKDIQDYIPLIKNNKMPLIKVNLQTKQPDKPYDSYIYWTQIIHGHQAEENAKKIQKSTPINADLSSQTPIATSPDGQIKVYQATNAEQCIMLGKGQKFCISQPGNTMWQSYRDEKISSFYFVYDNSRQDNLSIVVVDAKKDGIELTDKANTTGTIQNPWNPQGRDSKPEIYFDYLKEKGINTNIFKNLPKTTEERRDQNKLGSLNTSISWFVNLSPDEKSKYIGRGHQLTNQQFDYLYNNKFMRLLTQYVKLGSKVSDYQIDKIAKNKDLKEKYLHNRLIANQQTADINEKEYNLLDQKQKDSLFNNMPDILKLSQAIKINNFDLVKQLVEKGASINQTAVDDAAQNNNLEMIKYLVSKGANTPAWSIASAVHSGNYELVNYLISRIGTIMNGTAKSAIASGNMEMYKYIKSKEPSKKIYDTEMAFAAKHGRIDFIKYFIDQGVEINTEALRSAVRNDQFDALKFMIENGKKPNNEVLNTAVENGNREIVEYLIKLGVYPNWEEVNQAASKGDLDIFKIIFDNKAKTNQFYLIQPLEIAVENSHDNIVKYMLDQGVPASDKAVIYAVENGDLPIVKLLIQHKGNPILALDEAVTNNNLDIVKYLVENGREISYYHVTKAVQNGNLPMVQYLVEHKGPIYPQALIAAISAGRIDIVKYLVEKGADTTDAAEIANDFEEKEIANYLNSVKTNPKQGLN